MRRKALLHALTVALAMTVFPVSAAASPRLVLDAFSFFLFEGENETAVLPLGAEIRLQLTRSSATSSTITIPQRSLDLPPVHHPSGHIVDLPQGLATP